MKAIVRGAVAASVAMCAVGKADASCGSAFCFVNTNWSLQGIWTQPGPHVDLRFEYSTRTSPGPAPMMSRWARSRLTTMK